MESNCLATCATLRAFDIGFELAVVIGMEGSHHSVPQGEVRRVIAAEELMVLIMMGDAHERGRGPTESTSVLIAGMADYAGNLVVDLVREQYRRGDRY